MILNLVLRLPPRNVVWESCGNKAVGVSVSPVCAAAFVAVGSQGGVRSQSSRGREEGGP